MLKNLFQISIIFIINVNCGLIKRELSNNQTITHFELKNLIDNVTIPNTILLKTSTDTDFNFMVSNTTTDRTINHESNTFAQNSNILSTKELKTEINPNTKHSITSKIDNLTEFSTTTEFSATTELSTTTEPSQLEESSTIINHDEVTENKNGNILIDFDYTTELIFKDLFTTSEPTTITSDLNSLNENIQTTTNNEAISLTKKDNLQNISVDNLNTSIHLKLNNQTGENVSLISTELYHNPTTTSKSLDHQLKLNKNYDIVTNEIANLTIPNSVGNVKLAKFYKENSTNSKNLTLKDSNNSSHFPGIKKITKDREKLKENIVNKTEINTTEQNITENPINTITFTQPINVSTDTIVTHIKNKENDLPFQNNISIYGDVNNVEQNNLLKIEETKITNTSTVNNNNYKNSLNKNVNDINSLNDIQTVSSSYVELATTGKPSISTATTETTIHTTNSNRNEIISTTQNTQDYHSTDVYVTKNSTKEPEFMENITNIFIRPTTEKNTENLNDFYNTSTSADMILTTQFNTNNTVDNLQNLTTPFTTDDDILISTPLSIGNNYTTYTNYELIQTTPINEDLFSTSVTEPESSIETNSIEKTEKSLMKLYSNTTPFLNNLPITTDASSKLADMKEDNKNDTTTISSSTTVSSKPSVELTESTIDNIVKVNDTFKIMTPTISESNLNKTHSSEFEGMERSSNDPDYNVIIAISVSVIGIVALILLVGFLYVMRKRQKQLTYGQRCRPVSLDAYSLDNVSIYNSVRRKAALRASKRSYGNAAFDDPALIHNNMSISDLAKFTERKSAIYEEFKGIPQIIARTDEVPQGCEEKNRYANVIPLPETRVILQQIDNDEKTEYINANFVRGPKDSPNYYIACQAPLEGTVVDFWRMIWEQNSRVIIMATDLIENGIEKCADYLPASITLDNHITFGDFQITLKNREVKEKYAVSILHLKNMQMNQSCEITHFWYQWPETGVPLDHAGVIAMLLEARSSLKVSNIDQTDKETKTVPDKVTTGESNGSIESSKGLLKTQGPLVIHCSPGTGRTGTIATIDIALRSLETTKHVDIPQIVYYVRRGRASSVQTTEQYEFIYRVVNVYATKITGSTNDN